MQFSWEYAIWYTTQYVFLIHMAAVSTILKICVVLYLKQFYKNHTLVKLCIFYYYCKFCVFNFWSLVMIFSSKTWVQRWQCMFQKQRYRPESWTYRTGDIELIVCPKQIFLSYALNKYFFRHDKHCEWVISLKIVKIVQHFWVCWMLYLFFKVWVGYSVFYLTWCRLSSYMFMVPRFYVTNHHKWRS